MLNIIKLNVYIFSILFSNLVNADIKKDLDASYKRIFSCIEKGNCKNLEKNHELLASLIIAFDKTKNEKYIQHILTNEDFLASNSKETIVLYIIQTLIKYNKNLSKETTEMIINAINTDNISNENLYKIVNLYKSDEPLEGAKIPNLVKNIWIYGKFYSADEEAMFFLKYQKYFDINIFTHRINRLLITGDIKEAIRINNLFKDTSPEKRLNDMKIEITKSCKNLNNETLERLAKISSNDDGVNIILMKCLASSNMNHKIIKFATRIQDKDKILGDMIWKYQNLATIEALNHKQYDIAKEILESIIPAKRLDYIHHQFLLGWIKFRFLNKPKSAIPHFENILKNSSYAVSVARGNYWLARTYEAMQNNDEARKFYEIAAQYPTTFYGQHAIKKLGASLKSKIDGYIMDAKIDENFENSMFKTASILNKYKLEELSILLIQDAMAKTTKDNVLQTIYSSTKILNKYEIAPIVRYATRFGVFLPQISYPKIMPNIDNFTSSIIRQESGFTVDAISEKNAMGMMQVIPETAKIISKQLGLKYSKERMLRDKEYNIRIGSTYIKNLGKAFNDNKILIAASYNAGPAPVKRWINNFGNPDIMTNDDQIDWIESITYGQTRDYVMRIMENYNMYENIYSKDKSI
ncbi:lytic transglycosylase domain-containing protein [Candidatus Deianiraea vastatrix]|uniref:Soluble lytic murein transglycosylase n=1 Tax=Candidatus Deianiraea vastatrix TaxID=2163644 RepID=A0A5B8XF62_9RICK|nr:lytic transglycosylase domain-containing protein [Candidatus Deianiraea vastatrix]QED23923.1 Soluble lytic murein transglycosylase precursor [Candidatus Deianiraea vastatrix]